MKPLDMGGIEGIVETARHTHDYVHGFGMIEDAGVCKDCGFRLYCDGGEGWCDKDDTGTADIHASVKDIMGHILDVFEKYGAILILT